MRELKLNISQKSDYIKHINDNVLDADIVVWDDIATKGASEFEHEQLISIIDSRMNDKKSNIFPMIDGLEEEINGYISNFYDKHI